MKTKTEVVSFDDSAECVTEVTTGVVSIGKTGDGKTPAMLSEWATWTCIGESDVDVSQVLGDVWLLCGLGTVCTVGCFV